MSSALVKAETRTETGVEPISWTAIGIAVLTGLAATAIYEGVKWAFTDNSFQGTVSRSGPGEINTLGPDEKRYPDTLFQFCTQERLTFSYSAKKKRFWKVFDNKWFSPDCKLSLNWELDLVSPRLVDCTNARKHSGFSGTYPASAFRKYYTGIKATFSNTNGSPISTNAYVALGLGLPRDAWGTDREKQNLLRNPRLFFYAEVWEAGYCSKSSSEGGTLWRFFYEATGKNVDYYSPTPTTNYFSTVRAYRPSRSGNAERIKGKEVGPGNSGIIN